MSPTAEKPSDQKRIVRPSSRGGWEVRIPGCAKAVVVLPDRADAIARAKRILAMKGGGDVEVQENDQVVDLQTVRARRGNVGTIPVRHRAYRRLLLAGARSPSGGRTLSAVAFAC